MHSANVGDAPGHSSISYTGLCTSSLAARSPFCRTTPENLITPDGAVTDRLHRLPSHLSLPRRLLLPCCFALIAHRSAMPMGIIRHLRPQTLYTYYYLPRAIMLTPTITTLVLPIMMRYFPRDPTACRWIMVVVESEVSASSSSSGHLPGEVGSQTANVHHRPSSPDPFMAPASVTADMNSHLTSALKNGADVAGGRYSLRARQARQLKPYAFDRLEYKYQLKHHPDA